MKSKLSLLFLLLGSIINGTAIHFDSDVRGITTVEDLNKFLLENSNQGSVLVLYWNQCPPCQRMASIVNNVSKAYSDVKLGAIERNYLANIKNNANSVINKKIANIIESLRYFPTFVFINNDGSVSTQTNTITQDQFEENVRKIGGVKK